MTYYFEYLSLYKAPIFQFITDKGVYKCGVLRLGLPEQVDPALREIVVSLVFGGTEVTAFAVDSASGYTVKTTLDFIN